MSDRRSEGPLAGTRVVELVGLGPGPFCGMLLADLGADVLTVDRVDAARAVDRARPATNAMNRSKHAIGLDLKRPDGVETFLRLCDHADVAFEVFRPGVAERLGIGPEVVRTRNPRLVYGRLTGYGQSGPLADRAGQWTCDDIEAAVHEANTTGRPRQLTASSPKEAWLSREPITEAQRGAFHETYAAFANEE